MDKNEILAILADWNFWQKELDTGIKRNFYLQKLGQFLITEQVLIITGARRSGKSFLMRQLADALMKKGVKKNEILMINFEDPRFGELDARSLQKIYETYLEVLAPQEKPYIFLDEIQEVKNWEKWVRTIHELKKAKIILSGSNAKLLSRELATLLTGRHLDLVVSPLSFPEYLVFKGLKTDLISQDEIKIKSFLREYLEFGSFPEIALSEKKQEILLTYFDDILNKDLAKRYRIRKTEALKRLAKFYLTNVAAPITFNSLGEFLNLATDTVENFSGYLQTAYLTFFLKRFSFKVKEQEKSPRKIYAIDTGLANAIGFRFSQNIGRLAENLVFLTLQREKMFNPRLEVYYWQDSRQREVDFLIKEGLQVKQLIQVCWQINQPQTKKREIKSLGKAMQKLNLNEALIITEDDIGEEKIKEGKIKFMPLWQWLLNPQTLPD